MKQNEIECPICKGSGVVQVSDIDFDECRRCGGRGVVSIPAPPSSPTATAEEAIVQRFEALIKKFDWCVSCEKDTYVHEICMECAIKLGRENLGEQEAHNRAVQECIDFIKDWYENERALEGKDFYEELEKLKK